MGVPTAISDNIHVKNRKRFRGNVGIVAGPSRAPRPRDAHDPPRAIAAAKRTTAASDAACAQ